MFESSLRFSAALNFFFFLEDEYLKPQNELLVLNRPQFTFALDYDSRRSLYLSPLFQRAPDRLQSLPRGVK